jgi:hypothetical protein
MVSQSIFQCEYCHGEKFIKLNDSVLKRRYAFLENLEFRACAGCGVKYLLCPKCKALNMPIHLSLDPFGLKSSCDVCHAEFKGLIEWLKAQQIKNGF